MNEEEKISIENHFENALNDIVSGIKDSTATEIVMRQQSMILFYKRVMLEIKKRDDLISKLQKENTKLKSFNSYLSNSDIDYLEGENIRLQKENEELEFKLLARERGEAELETLIDQLKEELDKKDKVIDYLAEKLEEKSRWMTKSKWKIVAYKQAEVEDE